MHMNIPSFLAWVLAFILSACWASLASAALVHPPSTVLLIQPYIQQAINSHQEIIAGFVVDMPPGIRGLSRNITLSLQYPNRTIARIPGASDEIPEGVCRSFNNSGEGKVTGRMWVNNTGK
jgi:hypothetical protein